MGIPPPFPDYTIFRGDWIGGAVVCARELSLMRGGLFWIEVEDIMLLQLQRGVKTTKGN